MSNYRHLKIEWEDKLPESRPTFYSDKQYEESWLKDFFKQYRLVFNYSEFNPRTQECGSDVEREEPLTDDDIERDRIAKNMDGMIGNIVDYCVSPSRRELSANEPNNMFDYVIIDINGVEIVAGFDEVKITSRINSEQPRVVEMDVYVNMYEEKVQYIKDAYLAALPAEIARYTRDDTESLINSSFENYMKAIVKVKRFPYQFSGKRKVTVDRKYRGKYQILVERDGTENIL